MHVGHETRVALVVEDECLVRVCIVNELRERGWEVLETATGEGAIEHFNGGGKIDILFTDIQLAGPLNGWDVAYQLRVLQPDLPIIYTSANSPDHSRKVPGSMFFDKPYDSAEVIDACDALVARAT
jgi:CheY-like chemotaxis protein